MHPYSRWLAEKIMSHVSPAKSKCVNNMTYNNSLPPRCVEELKTNEKWVLPALKMMREICCLYESGVMTGVRPHVTRQQLIDRSVTQHALVILVTDSLTHYMDGVRKKLAGRWWRRIVWLGMEWPEKLCFILKNVLT